MTYRSQVSPVIFVSFELFHLLVKVVDPGVHPVGLIQQSVDGVVLALDLRLEAQAQVFQSGQATAHLIWVSHKTCWDQILDLFFFLTTQTDVWMFTQIDNSLGCLLISTKLEIVRELNSAARLAFQ